MTASTAVLRRLLPSGGLGDRGTAALYLVVGLILVATGVHGWGGPVGGPARTWAHVGLLVLACTALVLKRRAPMVVLGVVTALALASGTVGGSLGLVLVFFDALYTAALLVGRRARAVLTSLVVVAGVTAPTATLVAGQSASQVVAATLQVVALLVTPLWWASDVRTRTELADVESRRADLEREQAALARVHAADAVRIAELDRAAAVREERAAMARDLHDVVAGRLSAIAIHAEAALAGTPDAPRDRTALAAVREQAVASLDEMRSMILVLRGAPGSGGATTAPAGLDRLDELLAAARAAGTDVRARVDVDRRPLPAAVDHAAYRIVQEALANAASHGAGGPVGLEVAERDARLEIGVTSALAPADAGAADRAPRPGLAPSLGTATGLVTMTERARSLGGTLDAGPDGPTWRVRALLPVDLPADHVEDHTPGRAPGVAPLDTLGAS
ncbi:histidine kinase [Cellulomonas sp.]|uniref:sensor histidine kinase n=1 Tax=Cellulomonas sp. TaxID=40001 RepID=UPI002583FD9B|nr:histidine kinase [Cellulomonas sp.]MCR6690003.1 histidine kinase [Cellulomonas sp.]